ncbi:Brefeldin A sensitivity protein-related, domain of unknown function DUF2421 [Kalmanozyma brasiliensis GHG001]|uniref:Brefeldin A sensitivity protein-related, domain of unknown function DUF2421 n=1 Tax=Kalmanozyma brasiliensis (strain GHG001) TaxID=1365824 RepID=UPI0028681B2E|nr:Brefeldin A sensitivity protein-related, domain of unknown function DUF2421 [Kalmanozyma brasiliensis GHG001]EST08587.2 Brefeldin A sensitivity protein-related, domain of unknown function DUF2421 [Kalmanozyma brasiliensis GHG001]
MDPSIPSHSGKDVEAAGVTVQSEDPSVIPAISVTRSDSLPVPQPQEATPPTPSVGSTSHPPPQPLSSPVLDTSQESSPSVPNSTTTYPPTQTQGTRQRAKPQSSLPRAPAQSVSTSDDVDRAEKQQQSPGSSTRDDTNNGKHKPRFSSAKRHWKRFAKLIGLDPLPWYISWAPPCFTWPKLKPVIRSALLAWICMVIFLIRPAESALGNASFLILVAAFIQPAEVPFAAVVEREFFTLLFVCAAWAWSNIGIAISHAVRRNKLAQAQTDILRAIQGDYIEVRPSIVCAVFLSVGSAVVLYIKIRFGPSPFLFASVLSCILLNICLTYGPLYPFAFYSLGQSVVVPLAVKAAINILLSAIFFPKSVNSQFVERLVAVLNPIADACGDQVKLLQTSPLDTPYTDPDSEKLEQPAPVAGKENKDGFDFEFVKKKLAAAEGGMMPMTMASRLLTREISFGIANGDDLRALERMSRSLIAPADGWSYYYTSIKADIQSAHFPRTPVPSRLATPAMSPALTPRTSLEQSRDASESGHANHAATLQPTQAFSQHRESGYHHTHHVSHLHTASRTHSPALTPLTPVPTAHSPAAGGSVSAPAHVVHHDAPHFHHPPSGSSTPYRESPLHSQVFPHEPSRSAAGFRQLDEHPSVQPGNELTSSRFRKMARSIASASRSSSPRRMIYHSHHSSNDVRDHHSPSDSRYHQALDRSNQLLHNFVHKRDPAPVAIWESIRFGNLETFLHTSASNYITEMFAQLIRETSSDLLTTNAEAIRHIVAWLNHLNSHRYTFLHDRIFLSKEQRTEKGLKQAEETSKVIAGVEAKLADFRQSQRLKVLDPFKDALKAHEEAALSSHDLATELDLRTGPGEFGKIHHRYLYQAWLHQFHTISFTERMLELLREVETIQRQRTAAHVWYPHWPRIFSADVWRNSSGAAHETDEPDGEPDHIPDISSDTPAASRQRSRSSQTVVGDDSTHGSREGKDGLRDGSGEKTNKGATAHGHAHAHFGQADDIAEKPFDPIVDLGTTRARDPDALDPEGFLQVVGHTIYFWSRRPFHGNTLFGVKAAVLIALVSLPAFMKSSAGWCYENRAIWAIFMAQLTLARFRGETAFALLSRILATVIGGVFALVIWYISTGDGRGNAFGLGATTAVTFPFLMLFRIYFPGPPITPIIASVTTALIVGYSWKDVTNPLPGAPGYGWDTAWRRLVAVIIGVSAAYVFSYLPPTSTLRQYQRLSHAATIAELGRIYCAVVGIASHPHQQGGSTGPTTKSTQMQSRPESRRASLHHNNEEARSQIELVPQAEEHQLLNAHPSSDLVRKRIIAIRAKLRRLSMISVNVSYEFSLRGRWPAARYRELFDVQMQISKLLSHCLAIFERLGAAYSIALLRRTRFLDPRFLGDVVSVISMCSTALKTGEPLPQVTPCPLVDRFMDTPHGFNTYLPQDLAGPMDDVLASLPAKITMSTLQDAEYMTFSVGVATLFGLVVRIDKLCVAVKELVGESYAVPVDVHRMLGRRNGHH